MDSRKGKPKGERFGNVGGLAHQSVAMYRMVHRLDDGHKDTIMALRVLPRFDASGNEINPTLLSACQDGCIRMWNMADYSLDGCLRGHTGAVLTLQVVRHAKEATWSSLGTVIKDDPSCKAKKDLYHALLVTSSLDTDLRIWDLDQRQCIAVLEGNVGNVYALAFCEPRLYCSCQDTTIKSLNLRRTLERASQSEAEVAAAVGASQSSEAYPASGVAAAKDQGLLVSHPWRIQFANVSELLVGRAHHGYVHNLVLAQGKLFSASGDSTIKVWSPEDLHVITTLRGHGDSVLSLAADDTYLYSGSQDGTIRLWDMDSLMLVRTLLGHGEEILCISVSDRVLFSSATDQHALKVWDKRRGFQCIQSVDGPKSLLVLTVTNYKGVFYAGGTDNAITVWSRHRTLTDSSVLDLLEDDDMQKISLSTQTTGLTEEFSHALAVWISMKSVSRNRALASDCWRAAKYLVSLLDCFGFETKLAAGASGKNPVVYGRVMANESQAHQAAAQASLSAEEEGSGDTGKGASASSPGAAASAPTIVIYGHYDVMPAHGDNGWHSDPFTLTGRDGYLYGRGVTDNKGPLLCAAFAVRDLLRRRQLNANIVFVVEGEEEVDSDGLWATVDAQEAWLRDADLVLVSNNGWVGEDRPCLTYGLRGVVQASVEVRGGARDLHSGVNGGVVHEPMVDLCHLLSSLVTPQGHVLVPGFYQDVRQVSDDELKLYDRIQMSATKLRSEVGKSARPHTDARSFLMSRWRQPTLSVHGVRTSVPDVDPTLIPCWARATVSMRLVPAQKVSNTADLLVKHLESRFSTLLSPNTLHVTIQHTGDWWLGDPHNTAFEAASHAVKKVWGEQPLFVREGGTIPITRMLEQRLGVPGLHLPLGQSSDAAHLPNERMRIRNLVHGRKVMEEFIRIFGKSQGGMKS